jgi:hypothetical protein
MGQGGQIILKSKGCIFFSENGSNMTHVQSKMIFYYPFLVTKTVEEAGSEHTNNVLLLRSPFARK